MCQRNLVFMYRIGPKILFNWLLSKIANYLFIILLLFNSDSETLQVLFNSDSSYIGKSLRCNDFLFNWNSEIVVSGDSKL